MSPIKTWVSSLLLDISAFGLAAWWIVYGSIAAENIFVFWNWAFALLGLLSLANKKPRAVRSAGYAWYHRITEAITISILASQGHTFGAIARLAAALLMEGAREHHKNAPAAQEGGAA